MIARHAAYRLVARLTRSTGIRNMARRALGFPPINPADLAD